MLLLRNDTRNNLIEDQIGVLRIGEQLLDNVLSSENVFMVYFGG